ncbi:Retinal domain containing protein, partial [Asbolus verrucosus]
MSDNVTSRSRRKRSRNHRRKAKNNAPTNITAEVIEEEDNTTEDAPKSPGEYRVESPKTATSTKKPVKSKSLDDDDLLKIQELSEVSDGEDKSECKAIVSEAESDVEWELTATMEEPELHTGVLSSLSLPLEETYTTEQVSLISPEEELTLRTFLEGLNLVNSPEDAIKQVYEASTMESVKSRRARKRAALEQYFTPIVQNPRFLDVINEETSDLSDREQQSITHHLKQGTPERELPPKPPKNRPQGRMQSHFCAPISNPTILVGTKIIDGPTVTHQVRSSNVVESSAEAEVVYLDDSSNSTTPDPKSDNEDDKITNEDLLSSNNSSAPDLLDSQEAETVEEKRQVCVTVRKNDVLVSRSDETATEKTSEDLKCNEEVASELTPPPTPTDEDASEKKDELSEEVATICGNLKLPDSIVYTNVFSPPAPSPSPSLSSGSSSRATSLCTAKYNPMNSSIADIASISRDEELLKSGKTESPPTLRELCLNCLMSQPFGADMLQELAEVSQSLDKLTSKLSNNILAPNLPAFMSKPELRKNINGSVDVPVKTEQMPSSAKVNWVGLPTEGDSRLLICLSPTQKSELEKSRKATDEAAKLLDLHEKYINRTTYHESVVERRVKNEITSIKDDTKLSQSSGNVSNRLLAIIRDEPNMQDHFQHEDPKPKPFSATLPRSKIADKQMDSARLNAKDLSEWLQLARNRSTSESNLAEAPDVRLAQRRTSLPQEFYEQQMRYLREKEREIQRELEHLEDEKRKLAADMAPCLRLDDFRISKKGDFAEKKTRPLSMPAATTEFFRRQMYEEYMGQIAAREERKQQKVIKVTSVQASSDVKAATGIEDEFMDKVKQKQKLGKLQADEPDGENAEEKLPKHLQEFLDITKDASENSLDGCAPCNEAALLRLFPFSKASLDRMNLGVGRYKCRRKCCKEARRINRALSKNRPQDNSSLLHEIDSALVLAKGFLLCGGVWSPGQKQDKPQQQLKIQQREEAKDEPISPVWTPKSATSSPTAERKEFRPVKFESPVLSRKNYSKGEEFPSGENSSKEPPWKAPETGSETGIALSSTLQKRLPTSHSSPASGFNDFQAARLPRAQNPTITLLQKAREGQLPKGALYIEQEQSFKRPQNDKPPLVGPGEILYKIKSEYTSESDSEKPRKMADLGPRKFEGIGPTTRDGMPLILRSQEVKDANQSKWYKKMYDTIHKQRPHRDEFVTVRYKQRRGQYPYTSGYLSEPEPGAYDSDFTDYKYATLDRRRVPARDKENDYLVSSTMPRHTTENKSVSEVVRHGHDPYKNQPGRIENYIPGHSSISEKEAKEWWDEVMDIFDGHLEQQKRVPQTKSFINQALKESGYESDSTLVFRRRDDTAQQLSPSEQKEAYKIIQKGGDIPLHGLRKPAPERPKDLEYFPISPTLTRIRVHKNVKPQKEILCYPVTVHPHPSTFAHYKRTAPSAITSAPKSPSVPPSPPRRRSSRNNSTLRLISTMKVKTEKLPVCRRHETCFSTTSSVDNTNVKYLRDKITCKLSPVSRSKDGKDTKSKMKVSKVVSSSPELKSKIVSTLSTSRDPKTSTSKVQSRTNVGGSRSSEKCCTSTGRSHSTGSIRKTCKKCSAAKTETADKTKLVSPQLKTFGVEKRKVDIVLPKIKTRSTLVNSPDLLSPTEVKKAVQTQKGLPSVSSKKVVVSTVGKNVASGKSSKQTKSKLNDGKKMRKSKKEEINGEIAKKDKNVKIGKEIVSDKLTKCAGRAAGTEIVRKLREMEDSSEFGSTDTLTDIQRQKEAIQTDYFFQHLFLRDLPSPTPSMSSRHSWLLERAYQLQKKRTSTSEPTVSAMKVYLKHTKPVTDSKFRSLDLALARSRSASPKSVTWETSPVQQIEKRSSSLPPKLVFSQTSRPVSPRVERRIIKSPTPPSSPRLIRSPSSRRIMHLRSHPQTIERINELTSGEICESPRSKTEVALYSCPSLSHSTSSIDSCDRKEYQAYVRELLSSSRKSSRFKDLNEFYSAIEKFGQLEQTTSSVGLKPRRKFEDEIIDYDRWREVRTRERAEKELKSLVIQLKEDAKEKGFLFCPKEVDAYRWKKELDRGLRIKEKSVDNIKEEFEKLKEEESERESARRRELACLKDTYKPLWRGDSVLSLASRLTERRSQSEGRVATARQKLIDSERMLTHGIGSRLWSSLSSEQVNILKNQLSEIYSQNLQKHKKEEPLEYSIQVPKEKILYRPPLTVRRNSDTSDYMYKTSDPVYESKILSENEKKLLSQTISKEVLDHVSKRKKGDTALPLVMAKETRDATTTQKIASTSETESGSTDESTKTVIYAGRKEEIKKKVEYFENVAEQEKYSPTVYKPSESHYDIGDTSSIRSKSPTDTECSLKRRAITSQSYQDLKELFGEQELMKFATVPLSATRKEAYNSPERPQLRVSTMRVPSPPISEATSNDSFYRSRSLSPFYDEPLALVKAGEVRRLKNKFEYTSSDACPAKLALKPRRCRSDSNLYKYNQIWIPGQTSGDVELLRSKYEYPAHAGRGRSRVRRGGVVSPTFLRAEDRFMPHINIISKIANLYAKRSASSEKSRSMEELAKILGCPVGEVEKMRQKFDAYGRNISLLGHMFTSSPNIKELRDIAPYLAASWIAHRYPRSEDNTRSLSSPDTSVGSRDTSLVRRDRQRAKSTSPPRPPKKSSILKTHQRHHSADSDKKFDAKNQPLYRYQPEPVRTRASATATKGTPRSKKPAA